MLGLKTQDYEDLDVRNPAQLAYPYAAGLMKLRSFDALERSEAEELMIAQLSHAVGVLGLRGSYLVEANRAWVKEPVFITRDKTIEEFYGVGFEGNFFGHDVVKMDGVDEQHRIRALCLTFRNVMIVPDCIEVPPHEFVYVPALAVSEIVRTS